MKAALLRRGKCVFLAFYRMSTSRAAAAVGFRRAARSLTAE